MQTNLPQSVTNSCLFDSGRCTHYLCRLLTYHEGKLAEVHSPPVHPTKVAAKKNVITNMLQLFLFLRNLLWINMLHPVTDPFPIWTSFRRFQNGYFLHASSLTSHRHRASTSTSQHTAATIPPKHPFFTLQTVFSSPLTVANP